MHCRTVAVAVTGSWLQRLCGICPRAWLKDATPSSEPSSWCCRAWMNLAENRVSIYIYCYISIYIYTRLFYVQKWLPKSWTINWWLTSGQWGLILRSMRKKQPDFADLRTPCIANFTICWRAPRGTLRKWGSHPKVFVAWCEILVRAGNSHGPQILVRL